MYTVKRLSDLAGVTVRTLHYYDEIDLLKPTTVSANGYRHYDDAALIRLQQILFYREIGLELMEIKEILDSRDFDVIDALRSHRTVLQEKIKRLENLVSTVDDTVDHLEGKNAMSKKKLFSAFDKEQQEEYQREARLQYGPDTVNESIQRWNSYSKTKQESVLAEMDNIYSDIAAAIDAELSSTSAEVGAILDRWQENLRNFYEPSLEILRGLGDLYNSNPEFIANFQKIHAELPAYLQEAISHYVDELETAELERMLAEDQHARLRDG
ncbi:MAG: MerR family transcriptional regulator [Aggregatilineales bacterium]